MANDLLYGVIVVLFGAALMFGIYTYFTGPEQQPAPQYVSAGGEVAPAPAAAPNQCAEGEEKECAQANGCNGRMVCMGGEWSGCVRYDRVCEPGRESACTFSNAAGCQFGTRICNECGTGWSACG